jgi:hypothetical protein
MVDQRLNFVFGINEFQIFFHSLFSSRTSMTSNELQTRYNLQTHSEAFESSELKFLSLDKICDLLNSSQTEIPITPACHIALTVYSRLFF